jgi:acetyltransferase-like isoleucine patch superfamily enzyme
MIHRDCWIQVWLDRSDSGPAQLVIKSHAAIGMGATISAAQSVTIGEYVLLARNVYISDHGHAFYDVEDPIMLQGIATPKPVSIGNRSWLGQNVCVLPGASIGEHCVIGANSVVTTPIPDFCVAAGAPARIIKRYNKRSGRWERVEGVREVLLET